MHDVNTAKFLFCFGCLCDLMRCSQDFILLVLLTSWMGLKTPEGIQVLEFFAGKARIARAAHKAGYVSRACEIDFDKPPRGVESKRGGAKRSHMDINGSAGFVLLGLVVTQSVSETPRLMVALLLSYQWGNSVTSIAVVCSSWTAVNNATARRDVLTPLGDVSKPSVRVANKMVSRPTLKRAPPCFFPS